MVIIKHLPRRVCQVKTPDTATIFFVDDFQSGFFFRRLVCHRLIQFHLIFWPVFFHLFYKDIIFQELLHLFKGFNGQLNRHALSVFIDYVLFSDRQHKFQNGLNFIDSELIILEENSILIWFHARVPDPNNYYCILFNSIGNSIIMQLKSPEPSIIIFFVFVRRVSFRVFSELKS